MPYEIAWHIDNRVLHIKISGVMSVDEFEKLHDESFEFVRSSPHKVHAIADISGLEAAPKNLRMLTSSTNKEKDHRQGMTVLVSPQMPKMLLFFVTVILQTLRLEYRVCDTMDEAMEILRRIDADLFDLSPPSTDAAEA